MKFRPACAAVVLVFTPPLLLAGSRCAQAQEIRIVSPGTYENIEGEGLFGGATAAPYRYQQVFPAADFAALGNQPHWIVAFGPRADQSVTSPHSANLPDNEIRLSTTGREPTDLSLQFDDNLGSDVMQFYRGPLTMMVDVQGPGPGPRGFYQADYPAGVTPFLYDPSQGKLLMDFIAWQGETPKMIADKIPDLQTVVSGSPTATQGDRGAAAIFQFTFVPVPEPSSLTLLGLMLVLGSLCRRVALTKTAQTA